MYSYFLRRRQSKKGQSLVEYGLILVLISVACVTALNGLKDSINGALGKASTALGGATATEE